MRGVVQRLPLAAIEASLSVRSTLPLSQFFHEDGIEFTPCWPFRSRADTHSFGTILWQRPRAFRRPRQGGIAAINEIEGLPPRFPMNTWIHSTPGERNMNEYEVTFNNGEIVEIEAWTPEAAGVIALEMRNLRGERVWLLLASNC